MNAWIRVASVAFLGIVYLVILRISPGDDNAASPLRGGILLLAGVGAALLCTQAARRISGPLGRVWMWFAVAASSWAIAQALWLYAEVGATGSLPLTEVALIGFLGFHAAAAIALVIWLGVLPRHLAAPGRDLLDGLIIGASLATISWVTTLSTVMSSDFRDTATFAISLVYPLADLTVVTLVLIAFTREKPTDRTTLAVLALALVVLGASNSAYVYFSGVETNRAGDLVSVGGFLGFLLVAVSASTASSTAADVPQRWRLGRQLHDQRPSPLRLLLPYIPFLAAMVSLVIKLSQATSSPLDELVLGSVLLSLVLLRQFLAVSDNERLLAEVLETRDLLKHQALHDGLTGLANRILYGDRLDRALMQPSTQVTVMFCDLDDFKGVNDELGHEAGDLLLRAVADRLLECVRATDTVARLGGDEFAVLIEGETDAGRIAHRIVTTVQQPFQVAGVEIRPSVSVGVARHLGWVEIEIDRRGARAPRPRPAVPTNSLVLSDVYARETTSRLLLRRADAAMYIAKAQGKGCFVLADDLT